MGIRRSQRDWAVDAGLIAVAAAAGGLFMLGALSEDPPLTLRQVAVEVAIGCLACIALLVRRRWPARLALALIPAGILSTAAMGAVGVAMFTVASRRSWKVTVAIAGLHAGTLAVIYRLAIEDPRVYWEAVTLVLALHVALIVSGMLVRSQRLLVRSLRDRAEQAEEQQRLRVEEARHLERERLAREMHDVLAHRISLLAVHAGALEVRRSAPDEERHAAGVIRTSAYEALEDLREVIGMLRTEPADRADAGRPQPTLTDLDALVEDSRAAGVDVALDTRIAEIAGVPTGIGRHVYRVVQEGLTNARKHAPGSSVRIALDGGAGPGLTVEVVNTAPPGRTATRIPGAGTGLIGLRERMDLIGGRLEHGRTPEGGFRLRAWLPCPA